MHRHPEDCRTKVRFPVRDAEGSLRVEQQERSSVIKIRFTLNVLCVLLLAAPFMSQGGSIAVAWNEAPPAGSARSTHEAAGRVPSGGAEPEEHGLPQKAVEIARPFGFPISNSMVVSWIVAVGLIIFARVATRDMKRIPGGAQNLLEWLVEGLYGFLENIIGPHLVKRSFVFFAAGCLEIVSILFRPVSLSFRLYGNTFAGENMLETMSRMGPVLGWLLPIPFYFMELLVGLVQALVFMLLCAVFTLLVCRHEGNGKEGVT